MHSEPQTIVQRGIKYRKHITQACFSFIANELSIHQHVTRYGKSDGIITDRAIQPSILNSLNGCIVTVILYEGETHIEPNEQYDVYVRRKDRNMYFTTAGAFLTPIL